MMQSSQSSVRILLFVQPFSSEIQLGLRVESTEISILRLGFLQFLLSFQFDLVISSLPHSLPRRLYTFRRLGEWASKEVFSRKRRVLCLEDTKSTDGMRPSFLYP